MLQPQKSNLKLHWRVNATVANFILQYLVLIGCDVIFRVDLFHCEIIFILQLDNPTVDYSDGSLWHGVVGICGYFTDSFDYIL